MTAEYHADKLPTDSTSTTDSAPNNATPDQLQRPISSSQNHDVNPIKSEPPLCDEIGEGRLLARTITRREE